MPRLRSCAGQVAAEYVGVLLLVAVVVAALIGSQLHTQIAVEVERAICKIAGSSQCGEPGVPQAERVGRGRARGARPLRLRRRVPQ